MQAGQQSSRCPELIPEWRPSQHQLPAQRHTVVWTSAARKCFYHKSWQVMSASDQTFRIAES